MYGAGAIGCHIAGHLARARAAEVSVVARGATASAIADNGIRVLTPTDDFTVPVNVTSDPGTLGVQDYVIIALKIQQAEAALAGISGLIGPGTTIVPPSTGIPYYFFHDSPAPYCDARLPEVDPTGIQWETLPPRQVLPVVFWLGAHRLAPGVTQQDGSGGSYPVGELNGMPSPRAQELSELLGYSGLTAPLTDNIRGEIWIKFANSLCGNPIAMLTMSDMNGFASDSAVLKVFATMLDEVDHIGRELGIAIPRSVSDRIEYTLSTTDHKFSMLQDLEAGRPLELNEFTQSLKAVKRLSRQPTPVGDTVLALAGLRQEVYHATL